MPNYQDSVTAELNYVGNVVVNIGGVYYAIRQPDSGLTIPYPRANVVASLTLNPTQINPKSVTTTIASYSFKLLDKEGVISKLIKDRALGVIGADVEIYLGRSRVGMDFADYFKLPTTKLSNVKKTDAGYTLATKETTDRMNRPLFDLRVRLQGDILAATTAIISKDDISGFPSSGFFYLEKELIEYTALSVADRTFLNCGRGAFGTTPEDHTDNDDIYLADTVADNPLSILLALLTSDSGKGDYDTLTDGLGIDPDLIDVEAIEAIREEKFADDVFQFAFYNIDNALKFIEDQILKPCNARFTYARGTGKLTLTVLDRTGFVDDVDTLDHDSITAHPSLEIADTEIVNSVEIEYDYDEGTENYLQLSTFSDDDSIEAYGLSASPYKASFKGVTDPAFVERFAKNLLGRLSQPYPQVQVKTLMNKSLLSIGDKAELKTDLLASDTGELNFATDMEVVSRSINWTNGDVTLKLAFTSTSGYRLCYIAPSDKLVTFPAFDTATVATGHGERWKEGWTCRLFDSFAGDYASTQVNVITAITGDVISFQDDWELDETAAARYTLKFPDFDDATLPQRRYCYVGVNYKPFSKLEKSYVIVP